MTNSFQHAMDPFQAIADPNRRKILDLLRDQERCVHELVPHLGVTFGAVSQHLKILHSSGLVNWRKQGRFHIYRAEPRALKEVHDWTERYRRYWELTLDRLGDYLDREE